MENYTRIENDILEKLTQMNLSGSAIACALVLLRKTNGFNKTQDGISLSQFVKLINRSKPTVCKALKELQLVKICLLVKKGKSGKEYNIYAFNKNVEEWQLVKKPKLVKKTKRTSKENETQLVKKSLHTKETITKETIQKKGKQVWNKNSLKDGSILEELSKTYSKEFVEEEVSKMLDWLEAKGTSYKNYLKFADNWCKRGYEEWQVKRNKNFSQQEEKKWETKKEKQQEYYADDGNGGVVKMSELLGKYSVTSQQPIV